MKPEELTGTYTYRSFHNIADPVDDFNRLRFAQLEMRLVVESDGALSGKLVFSDEPNLFMALAGNVSATAPLHLAYTGRGLPESEIAAFHYDYDAVILQMWSSGIGQIPALAGSVLRASDHGTEPNVARAGYTASFLAVRRPG